MTVLRIAVDLSVLIDLGYKVEGHLKPAMWLLNDGVRIRIDSN